MPRTLSLILKSLATSSVLVALTTVAEAQTTFVIGGGGGAIPASGSGGTTGWPGGIPDSTKFDSASTTPMPSDAQYLTSLEIFGLEHSYVGDLQIVLFSPQPVCFNILSRPGFNPTNAGNPSDLVSGTFTFVQSGATTIPHSPSASVEVPILPGTYNQDFGNPSGGGTWPSGTGSILNVPLSQIPITPGVWKLWIYDWATGDSGTCTGWALHGVRGPVTYCTSGTSALGCVPSINASENPNVAHTIPVTLSVSGLNGQRSGMFFYGINNTGFTPVQWAMGATSWFCVKAPTQRTTLQSTGGTLGFCDGSLSLNWNAFQASLPGALGQPWTAGELVYAQGWYRDPGQNPKNTNMTNAVKLTYLP